MGVASHTDIIYVRTDTTAATSPDMVGGVKDASIDEPTDYSGTDYLGSDGYKRREAQLKDVSLDLDLDHLIADAPQGILRTNAGTDVVVYVTVHTDPTASAGSKGKRYPMKVTSYSKKITPGSPVGASVKLVGHGAPTAV